MPIHPVYGPYECGWKPIPQFPGYDVNEYCQIRNARQRIIKENSRNQVSLMVKGVRHMKLKYHLGLLTFFPHISPCETVDHINENAENRSHFIENLQWMNRADNTRKSLKLKRRNNAAKRSKPVQQWTLDNKFIAEYPSTSEAARHIHTSNANISRCANNLTLSFGGFKWVFKQIPSQIDLPDEKWGTSDAFKKILRAYNPTNPLSDRDVNNIRISNKGRILTSKGIKVLGIQDHKKVEPIKTKELLMLDMKSYLSNNWGYIA